MNASFFVVSFQMQIYISLFLGIRGGLTEHFLSVLDGGHVLVEGWQELIRATADVGQALIASLVPLVPLSLPGAGSCPPIIVVTRHLLMCAQTRGQFPCHGLLTLGSLRVVQVRVAAGVGGPV